jgi:hypothetical protein
VCRCQGPADYLLDQTLDREATIDRHHHNVAGTGNDTTMFAGVWRPWTGDRGTKKPLWNYCVRQLNFVELTHLEDGSFLVTNMGIYDLLEETEEEESAL